MRTCPECGSTKPYPAASNFMCENHHVFSWVDEEPDLKSAAESALSWLDTWAQHVGTCPDVQVCTCGLDAVRNELSLSLQPLT